MLGRFQTKLTTFFISEFEISNYIFSCYAKEKKLDFSFSSNDKDKPVSNISWDEAKNFCAWLSSKTGLQVDLPTEAQWEVTAGSDSERIFPWGNDYPKINFCNFNSAYNGLTRVDSIANYSPFKVVNMSGNVAEWCLDWYDSTYARKLVKGGSWKDNAFDVRISSRKSYPQQTKKDNIGFRIVINNHSNNGGKTYANENFQFINSSTAIININGM